MKRHMPSQPTVYGMKIIRLLPWRLRRDARRRLPRSVRAMVEWAMDAASEAASAARGVKEGGGDAA